MADTVETEVPLSEGSDKAEDGDKGPDPVEKVEVPEEGKAHGAVAENDDKEPEKPPHREYSNDEHGAFIPEVDTHEVRQWKSGLFTCTAKQCILSLCCLPCQAARVGKRLHENCGCFVACAFLGAVRSKFRSQHNIRGSICTDGYMSWFCQPCVLWQLEREMDHLGI